MNTSFFVENMARYEGKSFLQVDTIQPTTGGVPMETALAVKASNGVAAPQRLKPRAWWSKDEASGKVNPKLLAHDPENPRRGMKKTELDELTESIRVVGVRQPIIVTPRHLVPWVELDPKYDHLPLVIVSGARRTTAAVAVGRSEVPVIVRIYEDSKSHALDRSLLNKGQADLTYLEEGYEIKLLRERGCTLEEIKDAFGCSTTHIYMRLNLTKLHPDLQAKLDPDLPTKEQLPATVGGALGGVKPPTMEELEDLYGRFGEIAARSLDDEALFDDEDDRRFEAQLLLYGVIETRKLGSVRAADFIKEHALKFVSSGAQNNPRMRRNRPVRRRDHFNAWLGAAVDTDVVDWTSQDWRRIFEYQTYEQFQGQLDKLDAVARIVTKARQQLKSLQATRKPTREDLKQFMRS